MKPMRCPVSVDAHIARRAAGAIVDVLRASSAVSSLARSSEIGRYWSSRCSPPMSPIGITSMKVRSWPSRPHQSIRVEASSSFTPLSATVLILTLRPAALAALDAVQHGVELAPAGDGGELVRIERVDRDVDALHAAARRARSAYLPSWLPLVVSGELLERAAVEMPRQALDQPHQVLAHQRLAAGQPQLAHALAARRRCTAGPAPPASAAPPWAGRSCPPPCNRRSGSRSGRSPTRADRRSCRPNGSIMPTPLYPAEYREGSGGFPPQKT